MLEQFLVVFGQVATLFMLMAVGFALEKLGKLDKTGTGQMTTLLVYVATPCVLLDSFQTEFYPEKARTMAVGLLGMVVCYVAQILLAQLFFRKEESDRQAPYRFGVIFGNVAFVGIPLVRSLMGEEAVIYAVVSIAAFNFFAWTYGAMLMGGKGAFSLKKAILNPGVIAMLAGLPLFLTGARLPGAINSTVHYLGLMNTPLAMIIVGAQLARSDLLSTFRNRELYLGSVLRLLVMPVVVGLLLWPLKLQNEFYLASVILSATPSGGFTSMFSEMYGRDTDRAAQLVSLSTLLSVLTLPAVGIVVMLLA